MKESPKPEKIETPKPSARKNEEVAPPAAAQVESSAKPKEQSIGCTKVAEVLPVLEEARPPVVGRDEPVMGEAAQGETP